MRRFRAVVTLITAVTLLTSCATWKTQTGTPKEVVERGHPDSVRLSLNNGRQVIIYDASVRGERLVGWSRPGMFGQPDESHALADIQSVAFQKLSKANTAAAVLAAGAIAVWVVGTSSKPRPQPAPAQQWSCPLVYSRTETGWRLDSGTFGGAIMRALRRTDLDNLDFASPREGRLTLKLANELDETDYVDAIDVVAVDHAPGVTVAPTSDGVVRGVGPLDAPVRASDFSGRDVLSVVRSPDARSWESRFETRDPASAATRDGIDLWFRRPHHTTAARLVVDARNTPWSAFVLGQFVEAHGRGTADWYNALDAEPARARALQAFVAREAFLRVSVETTRGWVESGFLWEAGPEVVKRQVMPLDLTGTSGDLVHVRLDAPASFWLVDAVGLDGGVEPEFSVHTLPLRHPDGRDGPRAFDLMTKADGRDLAMETGDSIELQFDVPPPSPGLARSFLVRTTGWYRIHTPESGEPNVALLGSVMKTGGIAEWSAALMNLALERARPDPAGRRR